MFRIHHEAAGEGGGGGGETNTASNEGVAGVGLFKQKSGVNLQFKNINAGSSKITITDDTGNDEVDIDVVEANVDHDSLSGFVTNEHIDHSLVTLTAGGGLSGGGTIAANRTFDVDASDLTTENTIDTANDTVIFYDASAGATRKTAITNIQGGGGGGADTDLSNLASVAINTSLISDTTLTDDIGSSSIFWNNAYVAKTYLGETGTTSGTAKSNANLVIEMADTNSFGISMLGSTNKKAGLYFSDNADDDLGKIEYSWNSGQFDINVQGLSVLTITSAAFLPSSDSSKDLGSSSKFWDETFTDELVLHNDGAASAASDTIRLSATDLSAGNTMLSVNTEGTSSLGTGTPTQDRTIAIDYNGTTYYILASTSSS